MYCNVKYKAAGPVRAVISIRYGSKEGVQGSCWSPNIFGHKMVTSGRILMFHMSIEPYWSAQDDWIFENGATAFLVAKIGPKWIPHIWVVWRPTELKFGI